MKSSAPLSITRSRSRLLLVTALTGLFFATTLAATAHSAALVPQLRMLPATGTIAIGDQISVEVWIENVTNLYGVDIQLTFDPARFQVIDANPALAGVQITPRAGFLKPDLIIRRTADNSAGTIWYAVSQLNPRLPITGTGVLFEFALRATSSGTGTLGYRQYVLSTRDGDPIPADASGANLEVLSNINKYNLYLPVVHADECTACSTVSPLLEISMERQQS
jgi:hypothetical protein